MFHSILCAIDFSSASERAIEHATEWAVREKCALEIVHVVDPPIFVAPAELPELYVSIETSMLREAEERMGSEMTRVRRRAPKATGHVLGGFPAKLILQRIADTKADLVVVGTHGRTALSRAVLGSVADRILRASPIHVLLVPQDGRVVAITPRRIVVPTDFSAPARGALAFARAFASEVEAEIDAVHAFEVPATRDPAMTHALRTTMSAQLATEHPELASEARIHLHAREGNAAAAIVAVTEEGQADLVVIAATGRNLLSGLLLGGVTDRVARTSHVPVLVLRPEALAAR